MNTIRSRVSATTYRESGVLVLSIVSGSALAGEAATPAAFGGVAHLERKRGLAGTAFLRMSVTAYSAKQPVNIQFPDFDQAVRQL